MPKNEKILITGGSGLLGHAIAEYFKEYSQPQKFLGEKLLWPPISPRKTRRYYEVCATYLNHYFPLKEIKSIKVDLRDKKATINLIKKINPRLIIHTSALTDVDFCERHPDEAHKTNVDMVSNVIEGCKITSSDLIHISTSYVFDGKKGNYAEEDTPNPLNVYSKTKYSAEKLVLNSNLNYIIIRTIIYGWNIQNKKCFAEKIISDLRENKRVYAYVDQSSSPILVNHLAELLHRLYLKNAKGIFHVGCDESVSRYEFAVEVAEVFSLDKSLIIPVTTEQTPQKAKRPKDVSLNNKKVRTLLGIKSISLERDINIMRTYCIS
mgnify:CR=1 FL=1